VGCLQTNWLISARGTSQELLKLEDRVRDLTLADYTAVGRNAAGQIVAEREAADAALGVER